MLLLPVRTPLLTSGADLTALIAEHAKGGDIIAVSSKAVATVEGNAIVMENLRVTDDAKRWALVTKLPAEFCQAILEETARLNGSVVRGVKGALLTELKPKGMNGTLLVPNAGLDRSNIQEGLCIGWPHDPVASIRALRAAVGNVAVVLTDSCVRPGRRGVTAFALAVSGIRAIRSQIGAKDLFGKPLIVTEEAVADQIATAANMLMGNAAQSTPFVLVRDHGVPFEDSEGWVPGMPPEEDLFDTKL